MEFKLILKKINGSLSEEEQKIFEDWYASSRRHRVYFKRVQKNYYKEIDQLDIERAWERIVRRIDRRVRRKKNLVQYAAAAAIFIGILGGYFLSKEDFLLFSHKHSFTQGIALPGTDKAVLTLENGRQIALEKGKNVALPERKVKNGQLTYNKNNKTTASSLKWNIITTPRGGQFHLKLADGTKVQLNAESKLKYPVQFLKEQPRRVELLYGEAYFEVTPAKQNGGMPFKVRTSGYKVAVLGTKFNIKAYKDEPVIMTTLIEGKVIITDGRVQKELIPKEQACYERNSKTTTIEKVDTYDVLSWRRGEFSFNNKPLAEIVKVLSRWYNVDIVIENERLKKTKFNGVLSREQVLENILETINNTTPIRYSMKGGTLIIR